MGISPISIIGFGLCTDSSEILEPNPPARITTFIRIPLCNIRYIESKGNNILFYVGKEVYSKKKRISDIESELPPIQFVRISRSFIVNLAEVYGVITTAGLTLKSGEHLSVSRDRINEVKQAYINYLRGGF